MKTTKKRKVTKATKKWKVTKATKKRKVTKATRNRNVIGENEPRFRLFQFSIEDTGKFNYDPPGDWAHAHADTLRFKSKDGPFTISLRRIDADSPHVDLPAQQDAQGQWVAEVGPIADGLSDSERIERKRAQGFNARYRYVIGVLRNGTVLVDDTHNGVGGC